MPDKFAGTTAKLEQLVAQIVKEKDPDKCDELAAEIWSVLRERDFLRNALPIQKGRDTK